MSSPQRPLRKSLWWPVCGAFGLAALAGGLSTGMAPADSTTPEQNDTPEAPRRIVSTVLSSDEILMDLGLGDRLLAVGQFAADAKSSHVHDRVGPEYRIVTADAEAIVSLEPDLVFVSAFARPETRTLLVRVGVPIAPLPTCTDFSCIADSIEKLGEIVGRSEAAGNLVLEMNHRLRRLNRSVEGSERPSVLVYQRGGYTAGSGTLFDAMVEVAHGNNAAAEAGIEGHREIGLEELLAIDPDVILVNDYHADGTTRTYGEVPLLLGDPVFRGLSAIQDDRAFVIDPKLVLSSSHYAVRGAEEIARLLHGELQ